MKKLDSGRRWTSACGMLGFSLPCSQAFRRSSRYPVRPAAISSVWPESSCAHISIAGLTLAFRLGGTGLILS